MTGEVFELVRHHSIIGAVIDGADMNEEAFVRGVECGLDREGGSGGLLHSLFGVRTSGVLEPSSRPGLHSYLSGLLLGTEIAGATSTRLPESVTLVGRHSLLAGYRLAFDVAGIATETIENAAPRGLKRLAEIHGLSS